MIASSKGEPDDIHLARLDSHLCNRRSCNLLFATLTPSEIFKN
jgi:hypothetical protein